MTHLAYSKIHKPSRPCSAPDINFGGSCFNCGYDPESVKANASLIAAAPEMLEALKQMCNEFKGYDLPYGSAAYLQALTTIAKAEGKE